MSPRRASAQTRPRPRARSTTARPSPDLHRLLNPSGSPCDQRFVCQRCIGCAPVSIRSSKAGPLRQAGRRARKTRRVLAGQRGKIRLPSSTGSINSGPSAAKQRKLRLCAGRFKLSQQRMMSASLSTSNSTKAVSLPRPPCTSSAVAALLVSRTEPSACRAAEGSDSGGGCPARSRAGTTRTAGAAPPARGSESSATQQNQGEA